jgi:hypothetical protein
VARNGDTMTGALILSGDPSADLGAATKQYVDTSITNAAPDLSGLVSKTVDNVITANIKTESAGNPLDYVELDSPAGLLNAVEGKPAVPGVGSHTLSAFYGSGADWQKRDSQTNNTVQGIYVNANTASIVLEGDGETGIRERGYGQQVVLEIGYEKGAAEVEGADRVASG